MAPSMYIEAIGYLGSALVVVSMLMSSVIKLRVINTIGSCIFAGYALIIHSYPTAIMNFFLVAINVYNLVKLLKSKQQYDLIKADPQEGFVNYFVTHYQKDIQIYFPNFVWEPSRYDTAYIVFCGATPAGILLGRTQNPGELEVFLDYTTPTYRDCSVGIYLYDELRKQDVHCLVIQNFSPKHEPYLQKMGYIKKQETYIKELL